MVEEKVFYVRRKEDNKTYEFIGDSTFKDAEGNEFIVKRVFKEDNRKDIAEAIEILTQQIDDNVLEGERAKYIKQLELIDKYELNNPVVEVIAE